MALTQSSHIGTLLQVSDPDNRSAKQLAKQTPAARTNPADSAHTPLVILTGTRYADIDTAATSAELALPNPQYVPPGIALQGVFVFSVTGDNDIQHKDAYLVYGANDSAFGSVTDPLGNTGDATLRPFEAMQGLMIAVAPTSTDINAGVTGDSHVPIGARNATVRTFRDPSRPKMLGMHVDGVTYTVWSTQPMPEIVKFAKGLGIK